MQKIHPISGSRQRLQPHGPDSHDLLSDNYRACTLFRHTSIQTCIFCVRNDSCTKEMTRRTSMTFHDQASRSQGTRICSMVAAFYSWLSNVFSASCFLRFFPHWLALYHVKWQWRILFRVDWLSICQVHLVHHFCAYRKKRCKYIYRWSMKNNWDTFVEFNRAIWTGKVKTSSASRDVTVLSVWTWAM